MHTARLLIIGTATTLAVGLFAAPAVAAPTDSTVVTFEILAGTLDIDAPAAADLGDGAPDAAITGPMGLVVVTDTRADADASWLATVISTDFTLTGGTGSPSETITAAEVEYWSGPLLDFTGNGTFTPGQPTAAEAAALDNADPLPAFTHTGGTGNNTAEWNPTLTVNAPLDSQAGVYTGTVTHSVA